MSCADYHRQVALGWARRELDALCRRDGMELTSDPPSIRYAGSGLGHCWIAAYDGPSGPVAGRFSSLGRALAFIPEESQ